MNDSSRGVGQFLCVWLIGFSMGTWLPAAAEFVPALRWGASTYAEIAMLSGIGAVTLAFLTRRRT